MTRRTSGWSVPAVLIAAAIIAVALLLHSVTPGPSRILANYTATGDTAAHSGSIRVEDAALLVTRNASFAGEPCPEDGVFLVITARYQFTQPRNLPKRGLTIDGRRYLPAACQDDLDADSPVPGELFTLDTVFVVDEDTWQQIRGDRVRMQVSYLDPWYQNLGPRVLLDIRIPQELTDAVDAQARR